MQTGPREAYWWCLLCSAGVVHPMLRWGTRGHLAARSLRGDVHVSTPGAATERECGVSGVPSRTMSREEKWDTRLAYFSRCCMWSYTLSALSFIIQCWIITELRPSVIMSVWILTAVCQIEWWYYISPTRTRRTVLMRLKEAKTKWLEKWEMGVRTSICKALQGLCVAMGI